MSWATEYEKSQSRLRDHSPRCEFRDGSGERCRAIGSYEYSGYVPLLSKGRLCEKHRLAAQGGCE